MLSFLLHAPPLVMFLLRPPVCFVELKAAQFFPAKLVLFSSGRSAPRIVTPLETMDILLDQNATFICEVESRPPAVVTWTKNNQPIT